MPVASYDPGGRAKETRTEPAGNRNPRARGVGVVNQFPEVILPLGIIWLSMALRVIDWTDEGAYKSGWYSGKASRKECGLWACFEFAPAGFGYWLVCRPSGSSHIVKVCSSPEGYLAFCDCYDFQAYGAGFGRACIHIWAVRRHKAIVGC